MTGNSALLREQARKIELQVTGYAMRDTSYRIGVAT
jgi:hypothetical protein